MPGLHLLVGIEQHLLDLEQKFKDYLPHLHHLPNYFDQTLVKDKFYMLASSAYPHYPIQFQNTERFIIYFEGYAYNKSQRVIIDELTGIAEECVSCPEKKLYLIKRWVEDADGDYVVVIVFRNEEELIVFNDSLGCLPIYFYLADDSFVLSREMKLIAHLIPNRRIDEESLMEYLAFGCPLKDRTLVEGIKYLPYSTALTCRFKGGKNLQVSLDKHWNIDLDRRDYRLANNRQSADHLADLFTESCANISKCFSADNILTSLTGGMDSRAVAMALKRAGANNVGVCFLDKGGIFRDDVRISEQVAKALEIDWRRYDLPENKYEDMRRIIRQKFGAVTVNHGNIHYFNEGIASEFGSDSVVLSGDGGNTYLTSVVPPSKPRKIEDSAKFIINKYKALPYEVICRILDIPKKRLFEHICNLLSSYEEEDQYNKLVHFRALELDRRLYYESEDRSRIYYWFTSPFRSAPFVWYALSIPDSYRRNRMLYRHFLERLDPWRRIMNITYEAWKLPITTPLAPAIYQMERIRRVKHLIKRMLKKESVSKFIPDEDLIKKLQACLLKSGGGNLNLDGTMLYLKNCDNRYSFFFLVTIILIQEFLQDDLI